MLGEQVGEQTGRIAGLRKLSAVRRIRAHGRSPLYEYLAYRAQVLPGLILEADILPRWPPLASKLDPGRGPPRGDGIRVALGGTVHRDLRDVTHLVQ